MRDVGATWRNVLDGSLAPLAVVLGCCLAVRVRVRCITDQTWDKQHGGWQQHPAVNRFDAVHSTVCDVCNGCRFSTLLGTAA